jgi:site-specific DNA recombinase
MSKLVRCAIYTRKSSDEGLDQAFNSLHAQREACEAYVKSQASEGWKALPTLFDDGGFSGGSMERPALAALLADVDAGRVDTVVVYKVDRLTRSLADFAKIVDRLDGAGISFVSVTQVFNTTTSMGRLTLNVLLSFAQFEREVTGERIRDKIAASKAKGMWMGGNLPLGYDVPTDPATRALVINPNEAATVQYIFRTYLELRSVHVLAARLETEGVRSKVWRTRKGDIRGGARLHRGALFHLLRNRTYIGEIPHRDTSYPGAHPPIIEREQFDAIQALLATNRRRYRERPIRAAAMPLRRLLFDTDGNPMSPSFTYGRAGKVYRYYVSAPIQQGRALRPSPNALHRVSADEIEGVLERELRRRLGRPGGATLREMISCLKRVDLEAQAVRIGLLRNKASRQAILDGEPDPVDPNVVHVTLPIRCKLRGGRTWLAGAGDGSARVRRDPMLIKQLQQAHRIMAGLGWSKADGSVADSCGMKAPEGAYERKICRLAFLAPDIQKRILEGRQPAGMTLDRLLHGRIPTSWAAQRSLFGIAN